MKAVYSHCKGDLKILFCQSDLKSAEAPERKTEYYLENITYVSKH